MPQGHPPRATSVANRSPGSSLAKSPRHAPKAICVIPRPLPVVDGHDLHAAIVIELECKVHVQILPAQVDVGQIQFVRRLAGAHGLHKYPHGAGAAENQRANMADGTVRGLVDHGFRRSAHPFKPSSCGFSSSMLPGRSAAGGEEPVRALIFH